MTEEKKAAEKKAANAERVRDGMFFIGVAGLSTGIYIEFGIGYALIAAGAVLVVTVLLPVVIKQ